MNDTHFLFGKLDASKRAYNNATTNYSFDLNNYITQVLLQARGLSGDKKFNAYLDDCSIYHGKEFGNNISALEVDRNDTIWVIESNGNKTPMNVLDIFDREQVARYATSVFNNVCVADNRELINYEGQ